MINYLGLENFKSFHCEEIRFESFTLLAGPNASGKSNLRDAFRFLNGVGKGYSLSECLNGKYEAGKLEWQGIRGGSGEAEREGVLPPGQALFPARIEDAPQHGTALYFSYDNKMKEEAEYLIAFDTKETPSILVEKLRVSDITIFRTGFKNGHPIKISDSTVTALIGEAKENRFITVPNDRPLLYSLISESAFTGEYREYVISTRERLSNIRFLDPNPAVMRDYCRPEATLGDHGENLSAAIYTLLQKDSKKKQLLLDWISELTPADIEDIGFYRADTGEVLLKLIEPGGRELSVRSASDGTLRFIALVAALLSAKDDQVFFIEELDNGIHPTRLYLLVQMIEELTRDGRIQVIATSHSPLILSYLNEQSKRSARYFYRDEEYGITHVKPIMEIPGIKEALKAEPLQDLLASGWMEHAL